MNLKSTSVRRIVIVGGGSAGWMSAAALANHLASLNINITLIDSSAIGTVGVGEATIPTIRRFYQRLGLTDHQVIRATNATCKLGIEFINWHQPNSTFIHPFGLYGQNVNHVPFHHYWLKLKETGKQTPLSAYSLGVQLARENKFRPCFDSPKNQLEIFDWALHFDASLFAQLMREYSISHGVSHIDSTIEKIETTSDGEIASLTLENGQQIDGDLFIDCSGFKGLLISETLNVGYQDWSQWLLCDRAIALQSESTAPPAPRTIVTAHEAGWQWTIPLQHRQGNGHVYSSRFTDDETAQQRLLENIDGKLLTQPRSFKFTPGRRNQAWAKNVIAVGLASGFLEPLESTSIALVETAIDKIVQSLTNATYTQQTIDHFNDVTAQEYERVRDFIILHYKLNQRNEPMWKYCQAMDIPDSLQQKINNFTQSGDLTRQQWEIFGPDSWLAIFDGFKHWPKSYHESIDKMAIATIENGLSTMKSTVDTHTQQAPTHAEFLQQHFDYVVPDVKE